MTRAGEKGDKAMPITLGITESNQASYTFREAQEALVGYAFAEQSAWKPPSGYGPYGDSPTASAGCWAYRSYDCIPTQLGPLRGVDLLTPPGLDRKIAATEILAMEAVVKDVSEALARVPVHQTFWDLPLDGHPIWLDPVARPDTIAWWVWRAYWLIDGANSVGSTTAHKILHHKRPWLFPLVDDVTEPRLGGARKTWEQINSDLAQHKAGFERLEQWFACVAATEARAGGVAVPITRLRIHDILLWLHWWKPGASRADAIRQGHTWLQAHAYALDTAVNEWKCH